MNMFNDYIETRIRELSYEAKKLEENYRQDDAVFAKIKINVFDVCKTVFGVFSKVKPENTLYNEYIKKLDEFEKAWSDSAAKAKEFGDVKKSAIEEAKLSSLTEIKNEFIKLWGENNERGSRA